MVPEDGLPPGGDDQYGSDDPPEGSGSDQEQPGLQSQAPEASPFRRRDKKRGGKRERRRGRGSENR